MSVIYSSATILAASVENNAGGASARDLGIAGGIAGFAIIFMLMGGLGHRGGLIPTLGWFERFSEKVSGQPAWASLPCGLAIISLITALFGLYWDVSLHIDKGRDEGVFSNPSHIFILGGLYGIFAAGFFAICLGREERADRPGPTAIRIGKDWYAPLGGVMMMFTGLLLADRLPARRLLASPLRPGRHALGPDAPHAHRRRGHDAAGDRDHPGRGRAGDEGRRRHAQGDGLGAPPARRLAAGRPARRHVDVPGRVRLRRAAVPDDLPPAADHARGRSDARHDAHLARARRAVRRDRLLHHLPRAARPHRHRRAGRVDDAASRSTSSRRSASRPPRCSSPRAARCASASPPARSSARSAWPPSGAGRTSGCRCPGRSRSCPRRSCSASRWRSAHRSSAPGSAPACRRTTSPTPRPRTCARSRWWRRSRSSRCSRSRCSRRRRPTCAPTSS